ncbi:flavoprotein WrbA [Ferroglobus placidus DSM 10642]|uniref:Flavoprotein WrbA n=1 Tax=Ferroglobus placidus (strain DSM 10642 / AEDII12DO) TaxID=589924 RepID=D3RYK0_FERPA|nr:NAD(P)H:quinone oxidoreductase [Ferroglobus placidus]ADC65563.1 flavoprotein WrbA [Ferroglobus placidus DSM 10642]
MTKILVVFHSITGNTMELAKAVAEGAREEGVDVVVKRVPETIPEEILEKNPGYRAVKDELKSFEVANPEELEEYDAIIFGSPTRFGVMSSQMKQFIDMTGKLWMGRKLEGKVGAVFTSNEMPHGGKEATLLTMILPLLGHGMIIVGIPPVKELYKAGSYYGATSTGKPREEDLEVARLLGKRVASIAKKLKS